MTGLKFVALATETNRALQAGNPDANGQTLERQISDGAVARDLLARPEVAYLHLRSASNNCYQCRIEPQLGQNVYS